LAIVLFGFVKAWKKSTRIEDYVKQAQLIRLIIVFHVFIGADPASNAVPNPQRRNTV
jgi:hypothetical protein